MANLRCHKGNMTSGTYKHPQEVVRLVKKAKENKMDGRDLAELVAARGKVVDALAHLSKVYERLTDPTELGEVMYFMVSLTNWLTHHRDGFVPYIKNQLGE